MSLEKALLDTLKYSHTFKFPLTADEIYKYLIGEEIFSYKKIKNALETLVIRGTIKRTEGYYFLATGEEIWVENREKYRKMYEKVINTIVADLAFLKQIPFVKFVGITGSVAAKNLYDNHDVDLFLITSKYSLWLVRAIVVILLKRRGLYKKPYCPNIYTSLDNLIWDSKNVYIANEIVRVVPLINKDYAFEKFLKKNSWILTFLPNFKHYLPKFNLKRDRNNFNWLILPLEVLVFIFQFIYMKRKITSEKIGFKRVMFLKNDYSKAILGEFKLNSSKYID